MPDRGNGRLSLTHSILEMRGLGPVPAHRQLACRCAQIRGPQASLGDRL